jgi:hypothetical protein
MSLVIVMGIVFLQNREILTARVMYSPVQPMAFTMDDGNKGWRVQAPVHIRNLIGSTVTIRLKLKPPGGTMRTGATTFTIAPGETHEQGIFIEYPATEPGPIYLLVEHHHEGIDAATEQPRKLAIPWQPVAADSRSRTHINSGDTER